MIRGLMVASTTQSSSPPLSLLLSMYVFKPRTTFAEVLFEFTGTPFLCLPLALASALVARNPFHMINSAPVYPCHAGLGEVH